MILSSDVCHPQSSHEGDRRTDLSDHGDSGPRRKGEDNNEGVGPDRLVTRFSLREDTRESVLDNKGSLKNYYLHACTNIRHFPFIWSPGVLILHFPFSVQSST